MTLRNAAIEDITRFNGVYGDYVKINILDKIFDVDSDRSKIMFKNIEDGVVSKEQVLEMRKVLAKNIMELIKKYYSNSG